MESPVQHRLRCQLPYGFWTLANDDLILFDRYYRPMFRYSGGIVREQEPIWICGIHTSSHFYLHGTEPWIIEKCWRRGTVGLRSGGLCWRSCFRRSSGSCCWRLGRCVRQCRASVERRDASCVVSWCRGREHDAKRCAV
jgi:hypothetical protein